jgi:hypothetical protein
LRSLDAAEAAATTVTTTAPMEQVVKTEAMVVLGKTAAAKLPEPTARVEAMVVLGKTAAAKQPEPTARVEVTVVTRIPKARTETRE